MQGIGCMAISTKQDCNGVPEYHIVKMSDEELSEIQRLVEAHAPNNGKLSAMVYTIRRARQITV